MTAASRFLFVGLGGAGQRHARVFRRLLGNGPEFVCWRSRRSTPLLKPDFTVASEGTVEEQYGMRAVGSLEEGLATKPDWVVISTPTSLHVPQALAAARAGAGVFVEKPLGASLDGLAELRAASKGCFVAFQWRFHPLVRQVKRWLEQGRLGEIREAAFHQRSYVPRWHTYENHRDLYACSAELGGGVLLTEIHETDLCRLFFGAPATVSARVANVAEEKLPVEDSATLELGYPGFRAQLDLCFMDPSPRRGFRIVGTKGTVNCDMLAHTLTFQGAHGEPERHVAPEVKGEFLFEEQAKHFLREFSKEDRGALDDAILTNRIVDAARRSAAAGKEVKL